MATSCAQPTQNILKKPWIWPAGNSQVTTPPWQKHLYLVTHPHLPGQPIAAKDNLTYFIAAVQAHNPASSWNSVITAHTVVVYTWYLPLHQLCSPNWWILWTNFWTHLSKTGDSALGCAGHLPSFLSVPDMCFCPCLACAGAMPTASWQHCTSSPELRQDSATSCTGLRDLWEGQQPPWKHESPARLWHFCFWWTKQQKNKGERGRK